MKWNSYPTLEGCHSLLSPSKHYWINYSEDKLEKYIRNITAVERGNELHAFAAEAIRLGIKLKKSTATLNQYVNDAIGYRMTPEQVLYYSDNCFGTADAISFRKNELRIHDLKTGISKVSMDQLKVYAAIFCLEYRFEPYDIKMADFRIYQNDGIIFETPDPIEIKKIMDTIVAFDKKIDIIRDSED